MIRFSNPTKQKMASGNKSLEQTEEGNWETFPPFAEKYVQQIGAKILNRIETPVMHLLEIEYEGAALYLVNDDFPNGVSVEPQNQEGNAAIEKLYQQALQERSADGL